MAENEPKVVVRKVANPAPESFNAMFPRTINASSRAERMNKTADVPQSAPIDTLLGGAGSQGSFNYSSNIYRSPTRRFYSPDMTTSSIYLPRDNKMKNLWRRWIANFDPLVGAVLEYYTEMPWGHAEVALDDPFIKKVYEDSMQDSDFFLKCQQIDQEYLKIGEAIIVFNFDNNKGYINHIVIQNPDFIDIKGSPLVGDQPDIFLIPDNELRKIITSTDPRIREKKKYISREIVESVMYGRNIRLNNENTLHLARRQNPTDIRGTSLIDRLFKLYMLEDKLIEGTISAVDNHMFPLKLWKLGNPTTGWIPPEAHSRALAEMLQQQQFDPNFAIIYHHACCLTPNTQVTINDGTTKNVQDLKVGDRLIGGTGGERIITGMSERREDKEIISLDMVGLPEKLELTKEHHLIAVIRDKCVGNKCVTNEDGTVIHSHYCNQDWDNRKWNIEPREVAADELQRGDFLLSPINGYEDKKEISGDFARLLGYYVSDGCAFPLNPKTTKTNKFGFKFSFNKTLDQEYVQDVSMIADRLYDISPKIYQRGLNCTSVEFCSPSDITTNVTKELVKLGGGPKNKLLSEEVFHWSNEAIAQLLIGLFRGDGCVQKNRDNVSFCSSKRQLANQVMRLMHMLSFAPLLYDETRNTTFGKSRIYLIYVLGYQSKRLQEMIDTGEYIEFENKHIKYSDNFVWNNWVYYKIKKVEKKPYTGPVWNIEVDGDHLYLADYICSHNSYEQHGMDGKVMRWDGMFDRVDKLKMIALGINNAFLTGDTTFASASAFLNVMFSRLRSKRDMYEQTWMHKYFKIIAEKNEFFKRDKRELVGHFRVGAKKSELVLPKLIWNKSLSIREDQAYLGWLKEVWDKNKGPLSVTTLLGAAGLEFEHELKNKKQEKIVEQQIGQYMIEEEVVKGPAGKAAPGGLFNATFKGKREKVADDDSKFLTGAYPTKSIDKQSTSGDKEEVKIGEYDDQKTIDDDLFINIVDKYDVEKSVKASLMEMVKAKDIKPIISSLYEEGKLRSYNYTNYLDIKLKIAGMLGEESNSFLMDVNDEVMIEDINMMVENKYDRKRAALDSYFMGQLQGLYEQGIGVVCLRYANETPWQGKKVEIKELLSTNKDWSNTLYPNFELVYAEPQIINFENDIMEGINTIETTMAGKVLVEGMPIEYRSSIDKIACILPNKVKKLSFIRNITDIPEWSASRRKYYEDDMFKDVKEKEYNEPLIVSMMARDVKNNRDKMFIHNGNMYVDYSIGQKDGLFENIFFDEFSDYMLKNDNIKNALADDYGSVDEINKNKLDESDIEFLSAEQYIFPIQDKVSNKTVGWVINKERKIDDNLAMEDVIKEAQLVGGKWNIKGEPLYNIKNVSSIHKYLVEEFKKSSKDGHKSKRLDKISNLL